MFLTRDNLGWIETLAWKNTFTLRKRLGSPRALTDSTSWNHTSAGWNSAHSTLRKESVASWNLTIPSYGRSFPYADSVHYRQAEILLRIAEVRRFRISEKNFRIVE